MSPATLLETAWIKEQALALGFDLCGIVRAEKFPELARMQDWLDRGYAGEMKYLFDSRRSNPQSAMPGIRSVIVCALNYNSGKPDLEAALREHGDESPRGWISRYAWGNDYHEVLKEKLNRLLDALRNQFAESFEARTYSDTGPVSERLLAKYAGLGWIGKNSLLLNQRYGSWFFLGAILTTFDLAPSLAPDQVPPRDLCGTCRRCLDACPTQAFVEPYVLDASRCISYLTIELRGSVPEEFREAMGPHVFGCDICQDVCPWNRKAPITESLDFQPRTFPITLDRADNEQSLGSRNGPMNACGQTAPSENSLHFPDLEWLASLTEEDYRHIFRSSSVKRAKWRGLIRNCCIALGNSRINAANPTFPNILTLLQRLAKADDPAISKSARWALSRIQSESIDSERGANQNEN